MTGVKTCWNESKQSSDEKLQIIDWRFSTKNKLSAFYLTFPHVISFRSLPSFRRVKGAFRQICHWFPSLFDCEYVTKTSASVEPKVGQVGVPLNPENPLWTEVRQPFCTKSSRRTIPMPLSKWIKCLCEFWCRRAGGSVFTLHVMKLKMRGVAKTHLRAFEFCSSGQMDRCSLSSPITVCLWSTEICYIHHTDTFS